MPLPLPAPVRKAFDLADKELSVLRELHGDVKATVKTLSARDAGLKALLDRARGYAVFPAVGKASAVLGAAFGMGEVFEGGTLVGYAGLFQLTVGVQLGGQTFSQVVVFETRQALERFKEGKTAFAANASAVLVKAGAAAANNFNRGVAVFVAAKGGMMIEAAIGGQKLFFRPAVLGRLEEAPKPGAKSESKTNLTKRRKAPARGSHGRDVRVTKRAKSRASATRSPQRQRDARK